jgi:hypothetical protein
MFLRSSFFSYQRSALGDQVSGRGSVVSPDG